MSQVIAQDLIRLLGSFPRPESPSERIQLLEALEGFTTKIKDENVLHHEIMSAPLKLVVPRIASDLRIFEILTKSKLSLSTTDLVAETKASKQLLARILRYLATQKFINSPGAEIWEASVLTPFLSNQAFAAGLRFGTACVMPSAMAMPALLAENQFKDMSNLEKTAFQIGNSTSESMYEWLISHPKVQVDFQTWMAESQRHHEPIYSIFPLDQFIRSPSNTSTPLFVDVGGGNGQVCAQIRQKYPHWKGRVINQDLEATVIKIDACDGMIEHCNHDFFNEQPIKAANIYHLRNILHNWSDEECIKILSQVCGAMDSDSVVLIDGSALPDSNASLYDSYVDVVMGLFFGSRLRTLDEYRTIATEAGLSWTRFLKYEEDSIQYVMVLVKA
ncbi:S-adenosyl-L-methionine-dependent methyltransferase [Hypoxylon argillaceum]|nr:S-adenosyl-L-methionine-dependent methyltransferase [Hypoxylon argillaceum]